MVLRRLTEHFHRSPKQATIPSPEAKLAATIAAYVELCVASCADVDEIRDARRAAAPGEFRLLAKHPLVTHIIVQDKRLYVRMRSLVIEQITLGPYLFCIDPIHKEYTIKSLGLFIEVIRENGEKSRYDHPHVSNGGICWQQQAHFESLNEQGMLHESAALLIDALATVNNRTAFPSAKIEHWLIAQQNLTEV